jgi:hypothetical protein
VSANANNARPLARIRTHLSRLTKKNAAIGPLHPARTVGELLRAADVLLKRILDRIKPDQIWEESRTMIYYRGCLSLLWLRREIRYREPARDELLGGNWTIRSSRTSANHVPPRQNVGRNRPDRRRVASLLISAYLNFPRLTLVNFSTGSSPSCLLVASHGATMGAPRRQRPAGNPCWPLPLRGTARAQVAHCSRTSSTNKCVFRGCLRMPDLSAASQIGRFSELSILGIWHTVRTQNSKNRGFSTFEWPTIREVSSTSVSTRCWY